MEVLFFQMEILFFRRQHVSDTAVRTFIKRVRDKVGEDFIKNVPSLGYKININK